MGFSPAMRKSLASICSFAMLGGTFSARRSEGFLKTSGTFNSTVSIDRAPIEGVNRSMDVTRYGLLYNRKRETNFFTSFINSISLKQCRSSRQKKQENKKELERTKKNRKAKTVFQEKDDEIKSQREG